MILYKSKALYILFLCFIFIHADSQTPIVRQGVLKAKYKTASGYFITEELDYRNNNYIHFTISRTKDNKKNQEGYLNKQKYNTRRWDSFDIITNTSFKDGVLSDGYTYFNPNIKFRDTINLLDYDLSHFLLDSLTITYTPRGTIDTCKWKIYKSLEGLYYNKQNGEYKIYSSNGDTVISQGFITEVSENIFLSRIITLKKENKKYESIQVIGPTNNSYAELNLDYDKSIIDAAKFSIMDSIYLYKDKVFYKQTK